jgi:hypothetical protein
LHAETDVISDMSRIHRFGFAERMGSTESLVSALARLKARKVLP